MTLREQYMRERKSLQRSLSYYKSKGAYYKDPYYELPKIPKKITQGSINKLQGIRKNLKENLIYYDESTADFIDYSTAKVRKRRESQNIRKERKRLEREQRERFEETNQVPNVVPNIDKMIINRLYADHVATHHGEGGQYLKNWWFTTWNEIGDEQFAILMQKWADRGLFEAWYIFDSSEELMSHAISTEWAMFSAAGATDEQIADFVEDMDNENPFTE